MDKNGKQNDNYKSVADLGEGRSPPPLILGKKRRNDRRKKSRRGQVKQNRAPPLAQSLDPPLQIYTKIKMEKQVSIN